MYITSQKNSSAQNYMNHTFINSENDGASNSNFQKTFVSLNMAPKLMNNSDEINQPIIK